MILRKRYKKQEQNKNRKDQIISFNKEIVLQKKVLYNNHDWDIELTLGGNIIMIYSIPSKFQL